LLAADVHGWLREPDFSFLKSPIVQMKWLRGRAVFAEFFGRRRGERFTCRLRGGIGGFAEVGKCPALGRALARVKVFSVRVTKEQVGRGKSPGGRAANCS
jgi:hypothetical protein